MSNENIQYKTNVIKKENGKWTATVSHIDKNNKEERSYSFQVEVEDTSELIKE